jgi:hypothetical protein
VSECVVEMRERGNNENNVNHPRDWYDCCDACSGRCKVEPNQRGGNKVETRSTSKEQQEARRQEDEAQDTRDKENKYQKAPSSCTDLSLAVLRPACCVALAVPVLPPQSHLASLSSIITSRHSTSGSTLHSAL